MGRDVIAYLDYGWNVSSSPYSYTYCYARVFINRNYEFFSVLDSFATKGLPERISGNVFKKFFVLVSDLAEWDKEYFRNNISKTQAEELVASGECFYRTLNSPSGEILYVSESCLVWCNVFNT